MKVLVSDIDGTLIQDKKISEIDLMKIHQFINEGNKFILATGRPYDKVAHLMSLCKASYAICCSGASIYNDKGENIYTKSMSEEDFRAINNFNNGEYFFYASNGKNVISAEKFNHIDQCVFFSITDKQKTLLKVEELKRQIESLSLNVDCVINGIHLDITTKNVTKAEGIKKVIQLENYDPNDIYVVGDNNNDLPMFNDFYQHSYIIKATSLEDLSVAKYQVDNVGDIISNDDFNLYK